jgi:phosphatidylglycerol:prolipoprotein diacylglycerol transferase
MTSTTVQSYLASHCPTLVATMPVHPTFLYESIADLAIFFLLIYVRKNSKIAFETACTYFATYGFVRFFLEGLRTDSLYIGSTGIRTSQALSLVLVVASLIYIAIAHLKRIDRVPFPARLYEEGTKKQVNG